MVEMANRWEKAGRIKHVRRRALRLQLESSTGRALNGKGTKRLVAAEAPDGLTRSAWPLARHGVVTVRASVAALCGR